MRNPTSRHLQTPKPLSTFQSDLCEARHDGCALRHALLSPLTLQIISAVMVARCAGCHCPGCGFTSLLDFRIGIVFCASAPDPGNKCSWKPATRLTSTREYCAPCLLTPETLGSGELLFRILSLRKIKSSGFI